jgi:hypothetical protein
VPVLRVDYALQGVYLEAGEHVVELVYRPSSWSWGLAGTACGLVAVIALVGLDLARTKGRTCQEDQVVHDE